MVQLPDYDEIADCLGDKDSGLAAEAHGTLCGLLCTATGDLPESWIRNTLADSAGDEMAASTDAVGPLKRLYASTVAALQGQDMSFRPLLPVDERDLASRADALAEWCRGFLYGLAVRGLRDFTEIDGEIREFLEDLVQIGRADTAAGASEEDEVAYAELVEYVRVGVQLFYESVTRQPDLAGQRAWH